MNRGVQSEQEVRDGNNRARQLARIRRQLVGLRLELSGLQAYHAADLVAAVVNHMDRKDDSSGNV